MEAAKRHPMEAEAMPPAPKKAKEKRPNLRIVELPPEASPEAVDSPKTKGEKDIVKNLRSNIVEKQKNIDVLSKLWSEHATDGQLQIIENKKAELVTEKRTLIAELRKNADLLEQLFKYEKDTKKAAIVAEKRAEADALEADIADAPEGPVTILSSDLLEELPEAVEPPPIPEIEKNQKLEKQWMKEGDELKKTLEKEAIRDENTVVDLAEDLKAEQSLQEGAWAKKAKKLEALTEDEARAAVEATTVAKEANLDVEAQKAGFTDEAPKHGGLEKSGIAIKTGEAIGNVFDTAAKLASGKTVELPKTTLKGRNWDKKLETLKQMSPEELAAYDEGTKADEEAAQEKLAQKFANKDLSHIPDEKPLAADEQEVTGEMSLLDYVDQLAVYGVKIKPDGRMGFFAGRKHKKLYRDGNVENKKANADYITLYDAFTKARTEAYQGPATFKR